MLRFVQRYIVVSCGSECSLMCRAHAKCAQAIGTESHSLTYLAVLTRDREPQMSENANSRSNAARLSEIFGDIANRTSQAAGRASTFILALGAVIAWAASGPIFDYSDSWQLVINTGTTIITFLMVFLIQNSQNRDGAALQVKLDELIRASAAHNSFVGIEDLPFDQLEDIRKSCEARAITERAADDALLTADERAEQAGAKAVQ